MMRQQSVQTYMLQGPVGGTLVRMILPMMGGLASVVSLTLIDTVIIGQLGTEALAVMGYALPVQLGVVSLGVGLGVGTASRVARALGRGQTAEARVLTTHALLLTVAFSMVFAVLGTMGMMYLFPLVGASESVHALANMYILPYCWISGLTLCSMVGNAAMRASGDVKTPSLLMALAGGLNAALAPFWVFGWGGVPRLGIQGAIVATIIARSLTLAVGLYILAYHKSMTAFVTPHWHTLLQSWRKVLVVSLPAIGNRLLLPASVGILTSLLVGYGDGAVAAFGMGLRIESLAMIGVSATGSALIPFLGQNIGAHQRGRVRSALRFGVLFSLSWGLLIMVILGVSSAQLAEVFCGVGERQPLSCDRLLQCFLLFIPWSYGLKGIADVSNAGLDAFCLPWRSLFLVVMRLGGFSVPATVVGLYFWGIDGFFVGVGIGHGLAGFLALGLLRYTYRHHSFEEPT